MTDTTARHEAEKGLTDKQRKQLDYLLADFNAVKSEIARRSNLQRAVLAVYAAGCAALFSFVAARAPDSLPSQVAALAIWSCSFLVLLFYARERFQIARLGLLIATQIAPTAAELTGVPIAKLLPSETAPAIPNYRRRVRIYTVAFWVAAFAILPAFLSVLALSRNENPTASSTPNVIPALNYPAWQLFLSASVAGAAVIGTIVLLIVVLRPLPSPVRRQKNGHLRLPASDRLN